MQKNTRDYLFPLLDRNVSENDQNYLMNLDESLLIFVFPMILTKYGIVYYARAAHGTIIMRCYASHQKLFSQFCAAATHKINHHFCGIF